MVRFGCSWPFPDKHFSSEAQVRNVPPAGVGFVFGMAILSVYAFEAFARVNAAPHTNGHREIHGVGRVARFARAIYIEELDRAADHMSCAIDGDKLRTSACLGCGGGWSGVAYSASSLDPPSVRERLLRFFEDQIECS